MPYPSSASSSRRLVCIRPSCTSLPVSLYPGSESGTAVRWYTTVQAAIAALPQGSSLRSGLCCPGPSSLNRPHAPHLPAHLDFTDTAYTRCLRCASKLQRLGNQRVVPCFRGQLFAGMSSSATPGNSSVARTQFLHRQRWPSTKIHSLGVSHNPHPPIPMGTSDFGALLPFTFVTTCRLARLPVGADQRIPSSQRRLLLPGFQRLDRSHRCRI